MLSVQIGVVLKIKKNLNISDRI